MSGDTENFVERRATLTPQDLQAIEQMLETKHKCRFDNISREEMDFVKDLLSLYKETRSEVLRWVIRGVVGLILAISMLLAYLKYSGKHIG